MIFGPKTPLHSSVEILDSILKSGDLKGREGSVVIERKDGRKVIDKASIYFHDELVYAVSVDSQEVPIANRVLTSEKVSESDMEEIVRNCGNNPNSPDIARQLLVEQLISEFDLDTYVKEHFLDQLALVLSWDSCVGKWYAGAKTKDFTMPSVSFPQVKKVVASREIKKRDFIKEISKFFRPDELPMIVFVKTLKNENKFAPEVKAILALCNGDTTFEGISSSTGIGKAVVMQTINLLWKNGAVSLKYGTIEVSYESALIANNPKKEIVTAEEDNDETVPLNDSEKIEVEEPVDDLPELIDESLVSTSSVEEPLLASLPQNEEEGEREIIVSGEAETISTPAAFEFSIELEDDPAGNTELKTGEISKPTADSGNIPIGLSEKELEEFEQNLNDLIKTISARYGIPDIDMENVNFDDIIDIDPLYVETGTLEAIVEKHVVDFIKDAESVKNEVILIDLADELPENMKTSDLTEAESEAADLITVENADELLDQVEIYAETSDQEFYQRENKTKDEDSNMKEVTEDEDANTETLDENEAVELPENEVEESDAENVGEDEDATAETLDEDDTEELPENEVEESATESVDGEFDNTPVKDAEPLTVDNPINTLPQLMAYLSKLQADENVIDGEIAECTEKDLSLSEKVKEREVEYEKVYEESLLISEKCEEMRQAYEDLAAKLETSYKELETLDSEILESKAQLDENSEKLVSVLARKELIITEVEKTTRSFTIR